ncbi:chitin disaccharide deacetylase [Listeria weihenstephanensis]|uniref:Carbohydrate deacetylase n=1 Tax=Listeria weihenstephanensis TaxID=1006155 RepID=A0A841Z6K7_9LIST|nr:chitin disaccharide deacetylase [Listeria weihenstephanensis]MBC1500925.1 chitin disaccharide deacetylase [Listeria weihenstephanensis]
MKVIFNADDFGLSKGVVYGILDAYKNGVVRSTTMLANSPAFDLGAEVAKENPGLDIGAHLTLTFGSPILKDVPSVTAPSGKFLAQDVLRASADKLDFDEVEREFTAQIEKIMAAGITISHFDTHHLIEPLVLPVMQKLAKKYNVGLRRSVHDADYTGIPTTDRFSDQFYGAGITAEVVKQEIKKYENDTKTMEFMCHPAFIDETLLSLSSYTEYRIKELTFLTSQEVLDALESVGAEAVSFKSVMK